jgi:glycosyltransferase involved in cell wall biosynthesis
MARLSFVVPVYKPKPEVFEKHCKALAAQALTSWDAHFVLDGPSPEARKIISRFLPSAEVHEIIHAGAQAARNHGGALADGEFLCFLDSDCVLEPGASQMWVEQFDKHPEIGVVYSGYKFFGEKWAIDSEHYDPYTLRTRNYISGCFPMRRSLYPGWTEGLKSLQDWDMWLSLLEKAESQGYDPKKVFMFVPGYAFATSMPEAGSISGEGCKPENWLDRVDAVKALHRLPDRNVCVTARSAKHDGLALAKLIGADYLDHPNDKPNRYKTIVKVGFSLGAKSEVDAAAFQNKQQKKVLFWTADDINEIYNGVSFRQIDAMSQLLNDVASQYCEDKEAQRLLNRAGFEAKVMPLPIGEAQPLPLPEKPKWVVDCAGAYSPMLSVIEKSLPDIALELAGGVTHMSEYTGLIHFFPDRSMTTAMKRALLTGRHVITNVKAPHCETIDDKTSAEKFVVDAVEKIRALSQKAPDKRATKSYSADTEKLLKAVCA